MESAQMTIETAEQIETDALPNVDAIAFSEDFGDKLKNETTGCRLTTFALSCRRSMSKHAVGQVANLFSADQQSVGGSRQVIDRKHELVKPVLAALAKAKVIVQTYTIDYPEKGVRLVKLSRVDWLRTEIDKIVAELNEALAKLDEGWESVKLHAKERLGELYSAGDYPPIPSQGFGIELSFPAIKPDDRLAKLHPELYAAEQARIAARFDEAVATAEAAAAEELGKMLEHLVERLQPGDDGPKTLHASTIDNLVEFAEVWKTKSIGSNAKLDEMIAKVQSAAAGIDVKSLRKSDGSARAVLAERFANISQELDGLVIRKPVRTFDLD